MLDNINTNTKRNIIVAIYVLISILFTGLIPNFQPQGILLIVSGLLIVLSLFEVWNYQPNGRTKPFFWLVFIALIGVSIFCFFKPIQLNHWIIASIMGVISFILIKKDWM